MPLSENCERPGITQILSVRARFSEALRHCNGAPGMQMVEHILGFRPRKFITRHETITYCGYRQQTGELFACIAVAPGEVPENSREFVRFYVDNGDGEWQDAGYTSVLLCGTDTLPAAEEADGPVATYEARMHWLPESLPLLVNGPARMKAVLCWNVVPPANDPECMADFPYVWADNKETHIRLGQATRPRPAEKVGKLAIAGYGNPETAQKQEAQMPAYRKIVNSKPAFNAAARKNGRKKEINGTDAPIIPVYKSKAWSSAI